MNFCGDHARRADIARLRVLRCLVMIVCACLFASLAPSLLAQAPPQKPFYDQEPYDLVILKDAAGTQLKVFPLEFPNRVLPENPKKSEKLRLRRLDEPDEEYDVVWNSISQVRLFEQLVLDEANKLVAQKKFNEAFDYFEFLRLEYPRVPGLEASIADYLYEEAKNWHREEKYENSLALLKTLHARQPERTGLEAAMASATGKLIERYEKDADYRSVRKLVSELKLCFPNGTNAATFEQQLSAQAAQLVTQGKRDLAAGKPRLALAAATKAWTIWPTDASARELAIAAFEQYPQVTVGVTALSDGRGDPLTDWASRRAHRLLQRQLFEFTGYGANGGEYICPIGTYEVTDLGRGLSIDINPDIPWSQGNLLTGYDVARRLISLAQPSRPDSLHDWSLLCSSVEVRNVFGVDVRFHASHLLPMGLLTVPPTSGVEATAGEPYARADATPDEVSFEMHKDYFAKLPQQPRGIVERKYASRAQALDALLKGEVSIIDRLAPSDVPQLKNDQTLVVTAYDVPSMHCLTPNMARPAMRSRSLRRALVYAIDRQRILDDQLLRKQELAGCMVTTGPFARGTSLSDPQGYACNDDIRPRAYEPRLAMSLASVAMKELATKAKPAAADGTAEEAPPPAAPAAPDPAQTGADPASPQGNDKDKPPPLPPLILVHPPDDLARVACNAIVRNLGVIDLKVELRELPAGKRFPDDGNYDLAYIEYSLDEPLVDARRLFGDGALLGTPSSYISLALRHVDAATGWNEARKALHEVHRIAHEEVCLIPLWQITEHFAYRSNLQGVAEQPARLYQQVEQWQSKDPLPAESP